ncbi:MAG: hypothetical protein ABII90_08115 [Bacteroidota bacterium]
MSIELKTKTVWLDLSMEHFDLILNSEKYIKFKKEFNPSIRHKRRIITLGDFLREFIISYYRVRKSKVDPEIIASFQKGKAITGKIHFTLPDNVMRQFLFDANSNLRSLKAQALYLVIPLINELIQERSAAAPTVQDIGS